MKKSLYAALAIVLFPVIAMAQCPVPTTVTATVTFKRNSAAPVLDGIFSVDGSGTHVQFSRGNLQYQASTGNWQFPTHQYDFIGADNANIASDYSGWIDLFGWATAGHSESGTHYQPYDNTATADTYGNFIAPDGGEPLTAVADWGNNIIGDWRTLTEAEWLYLLETRASGATAAGVSDARFTRAKILTDGTVGTDGVDYNICGLILFPDGYNQGTPTGVSWSSASINTEAFNFIGATTCTTEGWQALEDAGCVFLPCAAYRNEATITSIGTEGFYWTATSRTGTTAAALHFPSNNITFGFDRHRGHSVRLVHVVAE